MGTKKSQWNKTGRGGLRRSKAKVASSGPVMARGANFQDWGRYQLYLGRKEKQRKKAGAGFFEMGAWVPYDFKTWFKGWGKQARGKK